MTKTTGQFFFLAKYYFISKKYANYKVPLKSSFDTSSFYIEQV